LAGWRGEASSGLDFFRSFCIKAKRTKENIHAKTFEVLEV